MSNLVNGKMSREPSFTERCRGALLGMFIGDALAMPVHWYYNTLSLRMDYGLVDDYTAPRNQHPDSILYRSSYIPTNRKADILHEQARYWGKPGIHYHQHLKPGENTLNVKLAGELLVQLATRGEYAKERWLQRMIDYLTTPGNHHDTYCEEYLRFFFTEYGKGTPPEQCGRKDEKHIGGYSLMLPLLISLSENPEKAHSLAIEHLQLTHGGELMRTWGDFLCSCLLALLHGHTMEESINRGLQASGGDLDYAELQALAEFPDETVVCRHFSSACFVHLSVPATMYLAVKYESNPEQALIANTMCGGDNCGRGAVLGALLGARHGGDCWPQKWIAKLTDPPPDISKLIGGRQQSKRYGDEDHAA